jgi:hypothetical protein
MSAGATNYSIKIYDPVSTLVIAENTFTNTGTPSIQDIGTIQNLPTVSGEIEILAKITSGETRPEGIIDVVTLYYQN